MILIKLLTWLLIPSANAYLDRNGAKRNYLQVFIVRAIVAIVHGAWMLPTDFYYSDANALQLLLVWAPYLIFQITSYWIFFELQLNIYRKRALLYYDTKEKDSGWIDEFFAWAGREVHFVAKVMALVVMALSIISIYERS